MMTPDPQLGLPAFIPSRDPNARLAPEMERLLRYGYRFHPATEHRIAGWVLIGDRNDQA